MLERGALCSTWASTVFVSTSSFLVSRSELPRQSTALQVMALPDGAFGEVPFFQFVNTYNPGPAAGSP